MVGSIRRKCKIYTQSLSFYVFFYSGILSKLFSSFSELQYIKRFLDDAHWSTTTVRYWLISKRRISCLIRISSRRSMWFNVYFREDYWELKLFWVFVLLFHFDLSKDFFTWFAKWEVSLFSLWRTPMLL